MFPFQPSISRPVPDAEISIAPRSICKELPLLSGCAGKMHEGFSPTGSPETLKAQSIAIASNFFRRRDNG
jgi:hypothetical protein